jgi:hypothetical protein
MRVPSSLCFLLALSTISCLSDSVVATQSLFLKEIVEGRCYEQPPNGNVDDCPSVTGSLLNVWESKLDADITAEDYDSYLQTVDLTSPPDKAFFWLRFLGSDDATSFAFIPPPSLISPERTPGGALVTNLDFCGVDQHSNCSAEKSNAYWVFWQAVYAEFASHIHGKLQILVEPKADVQFLERSILSSLQSVTSVTIYALEGCSTKAITALMEALEEKANDSVTCQNDMAEFLLCQTPDSPECTNYLESIGTGNQEEVNQDKWKEQGSNTAPPPNSTMSTGAKDEKGRKKRHVFSLFLFCTIIIGGILYFVKHQRINDGYNQVTGENFFLFPGGSKPSIPSQ